MGIVLPEVISDRPDVQQNFDALVDGGLFDGDIAGGVLSGTYPTPSLATGIVLQLAVTGTTRKVAFGNASVGLGGASAADATVAHGLGTTPIAVFAQVQQVFEDQAVSEVRSTLSDATNFVVRIETRNGAGSTATKSFYWLAIS